ncbi:hypothetical protein BAUCODRAFT_340370 [Baudoinia panamericana UAMH 10762]|uniref:Uncharacterized protein n=1 Tax=Baudoinia panamericana (strain UAMH 10762) TaxID=717646 RepID=M2LXX7_BAUPA|nr:uncharacterized protein BAUCODRAFT_340370 [Baudoinia panamericana UAMH 10762]EMC99537.1 hypothetical protein BAUCODRAFT_340370 [Baudoinia panamericana UAMH 10762]
MVLYVREDAKKLTTPVHCLRMLKHYLDTSTLCTLTPYLNTFIRCLNTDNQFVRLDQVVGACRCYPASNGALAQDRLISEVQTTGPPRR